MLFQQKYPVWFFGLLLGVLAWFPSLAQKPVIGLKAEMVSSPSEDKHWVRPLPDSSLLLVSTKAAVTSKKEQFLVTKLDHRLQAVWQKRFEQTPMSKLSQVTAEGPSIYLLFSVPNSASILLYSINSLTGTAWLTRHLLPSEEVTVTGMAVTQGQVLLSALQEKTILVVHLDPKELETKLLPTVYDLHKKLVDFRADPQTKTTELAVTESNGHLSRVQVKRLAPDGSLLGTHFLSSRNKASLQQARIAPGEVGTKYLFGTYGFRDRAYAQGIFSANLSGALRYYSLAQLSRFFAYDSSAKLRRIKRKYTKREPLHKLLKPKYQFLLHPVLPHPQGYVLIGEVYETRYSKIPLRQGIKTCSGARSAVTDGYFMSTALAALEEDYSSTLAERMVYTSYHFPAVAVLLFDVNGNLVWDKSQALDHLKASLGPNVTPTVTPTGEVVLAHLSGGKLSYTTLTQDSTSTLQETTQLDIPASQEKTTIKGTEGLIRWYGGNYVAYGFERSRPEAGKPVSVFFLHSISF